MRLTLFLALAAVAVAGDLTVAEFARAHRLSVTRDSLSGRDILRGGSEVVIVPGMDVALVDGRAFRLGHTVDVVDGRTVIHSDDAALLARHIRDGEAPATPARKADPPPAPRLAPALVRDVPAAKPVARTTVTKQGRFRTIVIDPGHGGVHTGYKGRQGTMEKEVVLDVSLQLRDLLAAQGIKVVMTRETDRHLAPLVRDDLRERVEFTEKHDPDLFLSVHANGADNKSAQGFEVFYPRAGCEGSAADRAAGGRIAEEVRRTFANRFDTPDRGVKEAGFYVIKNAKCPAVLVELEFVSNAEGEKKLRDRAYRKRLAEALADAIVREHRR
jgi:N-acetylmuramoyl-L-alanine amidase CwlD